MRFYLKSMYQLSPFAIVWGALVAGLAQAAEPATYLGAFEVRQITVSSRGSETKTLCGAGGQADGDESRVKDCRKRIHVLRKGNALLMTSEGSTFLLYANPFKKQFCQSWIANPNAGGEALFASQACRAYLADDGSYFFTPEKDTLQYMIDSQILTLSLIGMPMAVRSHQVIQLVGEKDRPEGLEILDRVDGSFFFISTGINYNYSLDRL